MANKIVTHPFETKDGRRARVVDAGGISAPYLEVNGVNIHPCEVTGPEILKLASEGRALWATCKGLLKIAYNAGLRDAEGAPDPPLYEAMKLLEATAPTFDHNEPDGPHPVRVHSHGGQSEVDDWEMSDGTIKALSRAEASSAKRDAPIPLVPDRSAGRCLIHLQDEPCPTCAGYKAAGL